MKRNSYLRKTKQIKRKDIIFELDEWAKIEEGANKLGITTSDYIRNMTLNGNILHADLSDSILDDVREYLQKLDLIR